ncbi:MAG TPA: hypothetical protein PKA00_19025 [Saprospiraceae bacterium]|nr:hypothetical protein [Saprospiraceae bacterium]HMQ85012.1 hypothetical protein [Saprospiraceae bacterium]
MARSLFVPIRIEGLLLPEDSLVCSPLADFERLPWSDGSQDYNYDVPFLGDSIGNKPFSDRNCRLKKGLHLHFILPHFLGQSIPQDSGLDRVGELPAAPNYWLIVKKMGSSVEKTFYVQSDYIHREISADKDNYCVVPVGIPVEDMPAASKEGLNGRPYAHMGLQSDTPLVYSEDNNFRKFTGTALTITGYGDINFSSFYPNCKGVFGFCDREMTPEKMGEGVVYEVYGWVNDGEDDVLFQYLKNNQNAPLKERLSSLFHVDICDAADKPLETIPDVDGRTIYYATFICDRHQVHFQNEAPNLNIKIAFGHTGTEAMAAMMAAKYPDNKAVVEEQLESANLFSQLGGKIGDIGPKFLEARHTNGFSRLSGGYKWAITAGENKGDKPSEMEVGHEVLDALAELNKAQHLYDDAFSELTTLKEQLYMDWSKYMQLAYPLPDAIDNDLLERMEAFLREIAIPEATAKKSSCGEIVLTKNDAEHGGSDFISTQNDANQQSLAHAVCSQWQTVFNQLKAQKLPYRLACTPGHYYWQPKPPVLLLSGLSAEDNDEGLLNKAGNNNAKIYVGDWNFTPNTTIAPTNPALPKANTLRLSEQITNPFILEWDVELLDTQLLRDNKGKIAENALVDCVNIMEYGPDFEKTERFKTGETSIFSGSVILNANARKAMAHKLIELVKAHKGDYFDLSDKKQQQDADTFVTTEDMGRFLEILNDRVFNFLDKTTPQYRILLELQTLLTDHTVLAQSLSGFNHICSMRGMTAQLPLLDPMGFAGTRDIAQNIASIIGNMDRYAPLTGFLFNPIRSGTITLGRLNLMDNFGVTTAIKIPDSIAWAETMQDKNGQPFLRPRLTQPARLHLSMLDSNRNPLAQKAFKDLVRVHNLPESNPICGWLIPNYLDNDLMVFDQNGIALGYLTQEAKWQKPPYKPDAPGRIDDLPNEHLKRVVKWIEKGGSSLLSAFLDSVQAAQDNMAPSHAALYTSQAILMGQPIAVVRAAVHFQLKGLPVINQSWNALVKDISNNALYDDRENDNWPNVKIPYRLGEHHQVGDGLIGYWVENGAATSDDAVLGKLVVPEAEHPNAQANAQANGHLLHTFKGNQKPQESIAINETQIATLLLDPRSGVHCTSGIVPVVNTNIDPALFLPAMQRLEMWFKLCAVLQPNPSLDKDAMLNLPNIEGKDWHWYDFAGERNIVADPADGFQLTKNTLKSSFLTLKNKH